MKTFDKFAEALGIWVIPGEEGEKVELKLRMGDGRRMRDILLDDRNKADRPSMFNRFERLMVDLIVREYPDMKEDAEKRKVELYVEANIMRLFESAILAFRFSDEETLEKAKTESLQDLKKSIGGG